MALPVRQQITYWGGAVALLTLALWGLGNVMVPFLVGGAIAYFMDPVADRLERLGLSRVGATVIISLAALTAMAVAAILILPMAIRQGAQLVALTPEMAGQLQQFMSAQFPSLSDEGSVLRDGLAALADAVKARTGALVEGVFSSAKGLVSAAVFVVVVPVVSFYMLLDWDKIVAKVDGWLPRDHAPVIRILMRDIDRVLAGFLRGQLMVCLVLGIFYSVALMLAGLQAGLVVGAIAGAITFIPYVGALIGGALAIGLALYQFWGDWMSIGIVAGIFAVGQFLEGNIITPKLMGNSVGLHPLWLIFALSAFGTLFGFVGMLVAVPMTAVIGVLTRFSISQYLTSRLYRGLVGMEADKTRIEDA